MIELKVADAIHRIKDLFDKTNGACIHSFSGGKDSTVVGELIKLAQAQYKLPPIKFVFSDTRIEYKAITDFIKEYDYGVNELEIIYPEKPFTQILRDYGKPAMSKLKSEHLSTYQRQVKKGNDPLSTARAQNLILGINKNNGQLSHHKLANAHFNFLHEDQEYKVANKCCYYLKKKPFEVLYNDNNIKGYFTGIRVAEGGVRSMKYNSCTETRNNKIHKMPIFDWTDEDVEEFIKQYEVPLSRAYTEYGLNRTGCAGCPFANDIQNNLKILYEHEPNKYKAWTSKNWLRDVYIDLEIDLPFDEQYQNEKLSRERIIAKRRYEMLLKYRPKVSEKYKPNGQISLFDTEEKE